jgi:hypothetical protein
MGTAPAEAATVEAKPSMPEEFEALRDFQAGVRFFLMGQRLKSESCGIARAELDALVANGALRVVPRRLVVALGSVRFENHIFQRGEKGLVDEATAERWIREEAALPASAETVVDVAALPPSPNAIPRDRELDAPRVMFRANRLTPIGSQGSMFGKPALSGHICQSTEKPELVREPIAIRAHIQQHGRIEGRLEKVLSEDGWLYFRALKQLVHPEYGPMFMGANAECVYSYGELTDDSQASPAAVAG